MELMKAWTYDRGTFTETPMEWDWDIDPIDMIERLGYITGEGYALVYGKLEYDYLAVYTGGSSSPSGYMAYHNLRGMYEIILLPSYPALIDYLGKTVPLIMAAVQSYPHNDHEYVIYRRSSLLN